MPHQRVQSIRSSTKNTRPTAGTREPGELYTNWPDLQLGVINASKVATDLIAVRFFSATTNYSTGDFVIHGGVGYRAKNAIVSGAFNAADWDTIHVTGSAEPPIAAGTTAQYWRGDKSWQTLDKSAVGLGAVDNTSDANKPISTAEQTALNLKANIASPTFTGDPRAPTPSVGDNDTSIATTAFVATSFAPLLNPTLGGDPRSVTPATEDNDTSIATTAYVQANLASYAPLDSPVFIGNPRGPTPMVGDNDTSIATTAFVQASLASYGPLASPVFTGDPRAPTPTAGDNDTSIATTAFVTGALATALPGGGLAPIANPIFTGDPRAPTPTAGDNDTSIATTAFVTTANEVDVKKAGDTMSGDLAVTKASPIISVNKTAASQDAQIVGRNGSTTRWAVRLGTSGTEGGSNTGSDFAIDSYNDAGAYLTTPFSISRATSAITAPGSLTAYGQIISTSGVFVGTATYNVLATSGSGPIYLRPNSVGSTVGETIISAVGQMSVDGSIIAAGFIRCSMGYSCKPGTGGLPTANVHNINHTGGQQMWIDNTNFGTFTLSSDYRIKKDVEDLPSMWETVKALRPIKYTQADFNVPAQDEANAADPTREADPPLFVADDIERWGFIAHELQETMIPYAADGEKDSYDTVQSPNPLVIIAALTKALQEVMAKVEALEATYATWQTPAEAAPATAKTDAPKPARKTTTKKRK